MRHAAALGLACALASGVALAQPFTVEDLLSLQDLGRTALSPGGRWLVMDVTAPWSQASRYDLDARTYLALGQPVVVDLNDAAPARPLLAPSDGATYATGAFSPDGGRLVVFRFKDQVLDLGVVTLASGVVKWLGVPVDEEGSTRVARWVDERTLLVLSRTAQDSRALGRGWIHQARSRQAWTDQAAGRGSGVIIGAGRYRAQNPPPPPARLLSIDLDSGHARQLATGAFLDMTLSPDRQRVALSVEDEDLPASVETPSLFKTGQRRRLTLLALGTGQTLTPCPTCDLARLPLAWSPDSRAVLVAARLDADGARFGYWRLGVDGAVMRLAADLTPADSAGRDPQVVGGVAWLAGQPTILARRGDDPRLDWWRLSAKGPIKLSAALPTAGTPAMAATGDALLVSTGEGPARLDATGRLTPLAPAGARLAWPARLAGDPAAALLVRHAQSLQPIWPAHGKAWPDTLGAERLLDVTPDGARTVGLARDAHGVKTVVVTVAGRAPRTVLTLNRQLANRDVSPALPIAHTGPDGSARTSWLYLPSGAAHADIPVIVAPYPGSAYPSAPAEGEPGALALSGNTQILTSAGYAVLVPSLPLAADADPGEGLATAMLAAVDAARARHPALSPRRLAVWGQSFGGWGALMVATQTDRFKAVIATSPITDLFTFHGALSPQALAAPDRYLALPSFFGWAETGQGRMLAPPWNAFERYRRNSPALLTQTVRAPVMLVTSDSDFTTGQSEPVFSALARQDKDVLLVRYRGEGHVVVSPGNVRDLYARALDFLRDALGAPDVDPAPVRPSQ